MLPAKIFNVTKVQRPNGFKKVYHKTQEGRFWYSKEDKYMREVVDFEVDANGAAVNLDAMLARPKKSVRPNAGRQTQGRGAATALCKKLRKAIGKKDKNIRKVIRECMQMMNPEKFANMFEEGEDLEEEQEDLFAKEFEEFCANIKEEEPVEKFDLQRNRIFMDSAMAANFDEEE